MKKILFIVFNLISFSLFSNDFKNVDTFRKEKQNISTGNGMICGTREVVVGSRISYSFRLWRKIDNKNGFFWVDAFVEHAGSGKIISRKSTQNRPIIIINVNLNNMADDESFYLKNNKILYHIGVLTSSSGRTYKVYSCKKNDKINPELINPSNKNNTENNSKIKCPHCNGTGLINKN